MTDSDDLTEARADIQATWDAIGDSPPADTLAGCVAVYKERIQDLESKLKVADVVDVGVIEHLNAQLATARDAALEEASTACDPAKFWDSEFSDPEGERGPGVVLKLAQQRIAALKTKPTGGG